MTHPLDPVADRLRAAVPGTGRVLVAIDGIGASGKSTFAAALTARLGGRPTVLLHADDFFNPPAVRHARGRLSAEGFWLDTYDYDALTTRALDPLRDGDGRYRSSSSAEAVTESAPEDALVLVEGTFLLRDRLRRYWDFSILLDVSFETAAARMVRRGTVADRADPRLDRYFGAQRLYFAHDRPRDRASLVVDTTADPVIVGDGDRSSGGG